MIIQNRRSGVITNLTKEGWEKIRQMGKSDLFVIIDNTDTTAHIEIPLEIKEFQIQMPQKIENTQKQTKKAKK